MICLLHHRFKKRKRWVVKINVVNNLSAQVDLYRDSRKEAE
jgi:hypothetical protein